MKCFLFEILLFWVLNSHIPIELENSKINSLKKFWINSQYHKNPNFETHPVHIQFHISCWIYSQFVRSIDQVETIICNVVGMIRIREIDWRSLPTRYNSYLNFVLDSPKPSSWILLPFLLLLLNLRDSRLSRFLQFRVDGLPSSSSAVHIVDKMPLCIVIYVAPRQTVVVTTRITTANNFQDPELGQPGSQVKSRRTEGDAAPMSVSVVAVDYYYYYGCNIKLEI